MVRDYRFQPLHRNIFTLFLILKRICLRTQRLLIKLYSTVSSLGALRKSPYRYSYDKKYKNYLKKVFEGEFKAAQKYIASHIFRRSFSTNLATSGVNIGDIAKMIGDSIRTTEKHYAQYITPTRTIFRMETGGVLSVTPKAEEMDRVA